MFRRINSAQLYNKTVAGSANQENIKTYMCRIVFPLESDLVGWRFIVWVHESHLDVNWSIYIRFTPKHQHQSGSSFHNRCHLTFTLHLYEPTFLSGGSRLNVWDRWMFLRRRSDIFQTRYFKPKHVCPALTKDEDVHCQHRLCRSGGKQCTGVCVCVCVCVSLSLSISFHPPLRPQATQPRSLRYSVNYGGNVQSHAIDPLFWARRGPIWNHLLRPYWLKECENRRRLLWYFRAHIDQPDGEGQFLWKNNGEPADIIDPNSRCVVKCWS